MTSYIWYILLVSHGSGVVPEMSLNGDLSYEALVMLSGIVSK
jgi:hypothetical protein